MCGIFMFFKGIKKPIEVDQAVLIEYFEKIQRGNISK